MLSPRPCTLLAAYLLSTSPVFAQAPAPPPQPLYKIDSPSELPELAWDDSLDLVTAPWRWNDDDWTRFSVGALAVVGTAFILDRPIQKDFARHQTVTLNQWANRISPIGMNYVFLGAGGLYAYGLLAKGGEAQSAGADALTSLIASAVTILPLKYAVGRGRPDTTISNESFRPLSSQDSFPSAHTTFAFTAAASITEHYTEPWVQYAAYGTASLVGLARLEQNAHWTSDVVAGALIGVTIGKTVTRMNQRKRFGKQAKYRLILEPDLGLKYQGMRVGLVF